MMFAMYCEKFVPGAVVAGGGGCVGCIAITGVDGDGRGMGTAGLGYKVA